MRTALVALSVAVFGSAALVPLHAQQPVLNPPLTRLDSLRADSLRADSIRRADTLSTTDRLLQAQKNQHVQLRPLPLPGAGALQPQGARIVFDRDSIDWATAQDLGELLSRVPGVFLEHSDWIGSPALPNYLGRGAASVEYVLDGVPWLPIGIDSIAADPSTTPLGFLDRVEVELSPSIMRVYLFTRRHDRQSPRTKIGVSQGDRGATRYFADFERRYPSGFGVALAADYVGLNPTPNGTGGVTMPSGWLQLSYAPTAHFGLQAQAVTRSITRNLLLEEGSNDTLSRQEDANRTDLQFRASWHARTDQFGPSLDLFAAHTGWASDSLPGHEGIGQFGGTAALRQSTWSAQLSAWHYTRWTSLDSRLDLGWSPTDLLTASVQVVVQRHDGDRRSQWATGRLGMRLPFGFHVTGVITDGHRVQAPSLASDVAQRFTDTDVSGGFDWKRLSIDVGVARDEGWQPAAFPEFVAVPALGPLGRTDWLKVHARFAPVGFFTLETVYQNPINGVTVDASPPQHAITTATLRSRFLRNFRSGIFELKLQGMMETWSPGIGGRAVDGTPILLPGATFFRGLIQFQIGPFIAYYDKLNLQVTRVGYVPRYPIQPAGSSFGIRWEFSN